MTSRNRDALLAGVGQRIMRHRPARLSGFQFVLTIAAMLAVSFATRPGHAEPPTALAAPATTSAGLDDAAAMARFLDRLMLAESGGRDDARNPRSTAVGPFQFIESTFLAVARRHFAAETDGLTPAQVLLKRTDRGFARRAAEAYSRDNAAALAAAGLETTFANLRLAFLAGAGGAIRVLKADPTTMVITALGAPVVQANPFMAGMTTADLAAWSARNLAASDLAQTHAAGPIAPGGALVDGVVAGAPRQQPSKPAITVKCERGLASCRRWVALAMQRAQSGNRVAARKPARSTPR